MLYFLLSRLLILFFFFFSFYFRFLSLLFSPFPFDFFFFLFFMQIIGFHSRCPFTVWLPPWRFSFGVTDFFLSFPFLLFPSSSFFLFLPQAPTRERSWSTSTQSWITWSWENLNDTLILRTFWTRTQVNSFQELKALYDDTAFYHDKSLNECCPHISFITTGAQPGLHHQRWKWQGPGEPQERALQRPANVNVILEAFRQCQDSVQQPLKSLCKDLSSHWACSFLFLLLFLIYSFLPFFVFPVFPLIYFAGQVHWASISWLWCALWGAWVRQYLLEKTWVDGCFRVFCSFDSSSSSPITSRFPAVCLQAAPGLRHGQDREDSQAGLPGALCFFTLLAAFNTNTRKQEKLMMSLLSLRQRFQEYQDQMPTDSW